jgi:hypothetical protein
MFPKLPSASRRRRRRRVVEQERQFREVLEHCPAAVYDFTALTQRNNKPSRSESFGRGIPGNGDVIGRREPQEGHGRPRVSLGRCGFNGSARLN